MHLYLKLIKGVFSSIVDSINWLFDDSGRTSKARKTQDKNIDKINTSRMRRDGRYGGKWDRWTG